jgi:hypothetical protein
LGGAQKQSRAQFYAYLYSTRSNHLSDLAIARRLSNHNNILWLSDIAILRIGNQDIAACQADKTWMRATVRRKSRHIILVFIGGILTGLVVMLQVFRFVIPMPGQSRKMRSVRESHSDPDSYSLFH